MENKLDEISKDLRQIRHNGNGFLIFMCFMAMFVGCVYLEDIMDESRKTNTNLKTIINILSRDSIMKSQERQSHERSATKKKR